LSCHCCLPAGLACPEPFAVTRNETCVIKYPDTVVDIVEPDFPPYSVIYPGPTLTTFPQQTLVGSTALLDIRNFLGSQGFLGFGGRYALLGFGFLGWFRGEGTPKKSSSATPCHGQGHSPIPGGSNLALGTSRDGESMESPGPGKDLSLKSHPNQPREFWNGLGWKGT
uniref:Keratin n=1 Tax=Junco hyemalis TaxID=40217 RepID=A0A8C5IVD3_JUNHY